MNTYLQLTDVVDGLNELSSREEQERLWLSDGSSGEVSSFTEAICVIFDDGGVTRAIESGSLPEQMRILFEELNALIDKVPENVAPEETMNHPAMKDIQRVSQELLSRLQVVE